MNIDKYISELIIRNDCVIVPGFGAFICSYVPAGIHPVIHSFSPPSRDIVFNSQLKHNDGLLANYICQNEKIGFSDAMKHIETFVAECNKSLIQNGQCELQKTGTLIFSGNNTLTFQPVNNSVFLSDAFGLSSFISPAIRREGVEERLEKVFAKKQASDAPQAGSKGRLRKIAMLAVPAAAMLIWGFMNIHVIKDISTSNTDFFSIFYSNTDSAPDIKNGDVFNPVFRENLNRNVALIYNINIQTAVEEALPAHSSDYQAENTGTCNYYIIGSCNKNKDLAENYVRKLKTKGYGAGIIEPENGGLFKVYISCASNHEQAQEALKKIQQSENPQAWLYKK